MTIWAAVTVTYSASLVENGYVIAGYVTDGSISSDSTWATVSADAAVWTDV